MHMKTKLFLVMGLAVVMLGTSCKPENTRRNRLIMTHLTSSTTKKQSDLNACETAKANYQKQIDDLNKQIADLLKEKNRC